MLKCNNIIGIDIGGSHVSASIVDICVSGKQRFNLVRKDVNALGTAYNVIEKISQCLKETINGETTIDAVGVAFPGPFDYQKGVSAITNVGGKFDQIFALHVLQALKDFTGLRNTKFRFSNDATCFAVGAHNRHQLRAKRTIFLTLGTGFGSAFMEDGALLNNHPALPSSGAFYDQHFLDATADDYFSTRWFLNEYKRLSGKEASSVKEIAESDSDFVVPIFNQFGSNLGSFLFKWLKQFECNQLVIGGNISKAGSSFGPSLKKQLDQLEKSVNIIFCDDDTEECILTGAAIVAIGENNQQCTHSNIKIKRKTTQPILPLAASTGPNSSYDTFPSIQSRYPVYKGFDTLAEKIKNEKIIIIDGYVGVLWEIFREQLHCELQAKNKTVFWYDINACRKTQHEIDTMIADNLNGDDLVFGKKYQDNLVNFFDESKLTLMQPDLSVDICILYGTGAALSNWIGHYMYLDVPKNEIQYRMRACSIRNIGSNELLAHSQMYKRFYFVDWPVLNKHKDHLLPKIDTIVDEQRIDSITWMDGNDFRNTLNEILEHSFRARPWFEAGVWGGNWMKKNIFGLCKDEVNYAWSFELITPENGIVIEGNQYLLEVSFDFLLFHDSKKLLGKAAHRFGKEFPIRFDFLDTYNGGNLSIQCHPRTTYIKENFGENFTQDETYYILDCEPDAKVYLGFQDDIEPVRFKEALIEAQDKKIALNEEKYVQVHDAHKHDLFLIPNGTIHASGKNNLVLEISSTPYIFTFKMYDWLRLDLNGQSRPINIDHAFNNLYFDRKGNYVEEKLISKPVVEKEWNDGRRLKLPTHEEHFYTVDRYEFTGTIQIHTNEQCHVCMLVEGDKVEVIANGKNTLFHYAETFVIPAGVKTYELKHQGDKRVFVVIAYVKDECCEN